MRPFLSTSPDRIFHVFSSPFHFVFALKVPFLFMSLFMFTAILISDMFSSSLLFYFVPSASCRSSFITLISPFSCLLLQGLFFLRSQIKWHTVAYFSDEKFTDAFRNTSDLISKLWFLKLKNFSLKLQ